jgi:apolipoprotein N-acyltransferase
VVARSGQFETEVLEGRVQPMAGATPWVRFGDGPLAGLAALIAVGAALRRRHGER